MSVLAYAKPGTYELSIINKQGLWLRQKGTWRRGKRLSRTHTHTHTHSHIHTHKYKTHTCTQSVHTYTTLFSCFLCLLAV